MFGLAEPEVALLAAPSRETETPALRSQRWLKPAVLVGSEIPRYALLRDGERNDDGALWQTGRELLPRNVRLIGIDGRAFSASPGNDKRVRSDEGDARCHLCVILLALVQECAARDRFAIPPAR